MSATKEGMTDVERLEARETSLAAALVIALSNKATARKIARTMTPEALGRISASLQNNGWPRANDQLWDAIGEAQEVTRG